MNAADSHLHIIFSVNETLEKNKKIEEKEIEKKKEKERKKENSVKEAWHNCIFSIVCCAPPAG